MHYVFFRLIIYKNKFFSSFLASSFWPKNLAFARVWGGVQPPAPLARTPMRRPTTNPQQIEVMGLGLLRSQLPDYGSIPRRLTAGASCAPPGGLLTNIRYVTVHLQSHQGTEPHAV